MLRILLLLGVATAAWAQVDFQREIRPILSDNCFHCHGPDRTTRMANLRLDTREGAFAVRKKGAAIVPGKPGESLILQRINHANPALRMPPEAAHKVISAKDRETLTRWIAAGAPWKEHWAFQAPVRPAVPAADEWGRNPIDRFLLERMTAAKLAPAPEADRRTLIRRVSLDLTGLPPKPAEVEAFVADSSPEAYEKLVDRLLASPHYGEHRARYWLDAARYADTHGLHYDNYREMWPYRDWVIQAFNKNLPFDKFTLWQVAGDLLPNRTPEQQIASGFQRCNVTTNEGGVILDEVQAMYDKDRADTTGTVFLGLTVGCATCHDHKFDPISQKDFYALTAFYRNTVQKPMDGNIWDTPPVLVVPKAEDAARWKELPAAQRAAAEAVAAARANSAFPGWYAGSKRPKVKSPLGGEVYRFREPEMSFVDQKHVERPNLKLFTRTQPFTLSIRFFLPTVDANFNRTILSQFERLPRDRARGWAVEVNDRRPTFRILGDNNRGIEVRAPASRKIEPGQWHTVVVTYDGQGLRDSLGMVIDGEAVTGEGINNAIADLAGDFKTTAPLRLGSDGNKRFFPLGKISDIRVYPRVVNLEEARSLAYFPALAANDKQAWENYYLSHIDKAYRAAAARRDALAAERKAIERRGAVTLVMQEKADSMPMANILYRGQYDQPREKVEPAVPGVLPPLPAGAPKNRLGLAQWLVDPSNPLTARVTVNRLWQEIFGTGIVKTAEDFGSQGEVPSHPELLDWLAVEFRETGWDVKRMVKLMVMSAAYRQAAVTTPEKLRADPENRLLARGPRFRMDGEMVRDYALAASGLLVETIGGPSVRPYQPDNVWETVAMEDSNTRFYQRDSGDGLYRRSLYTFWKRAAPPASMDIFNAPSRENCTVRRERTNTPLQALVTMNDVQFVEAARHLAQRALESNRQDPAAQLNYISAWVLARPLGPKESEITAHAYRDFLRYYDSNPADARKLLAVGASKADPALSRAEFAALTMVTNQLFNLDEVVSK